MKLKKSSINYTVITLLVALLSVIIANREVGLAGDTKTYYNKFIIGSACKCMGDFEIGFELFLLPMYVLSFTPEMIFFALSLLINILIFLSSVKIIDLLDNERFSMPQYKSYIALFSVILMLPITYQIHTNVIRQGISSLILLLSILYYFEGSTKKSLLLLIISATFHSSAILIIPFYLLFFYTRLEIKTSFYISILLFILLSLLYLFNYSEILVKNTSDFLNIPVWELVSSYGSDSSFQSGTRYDFYIFTLMILLPLLVYSLKHNTVRSYFIFIMISTIPFLLLGWGAYSNRYLFNVWVYIVFGIIAVITSKTRSLKSFYLLLFSMSFIINLIYVYM